MENESFRVCRSISRFWASLAVLTEQREKGEIFFLSSKMEFQRRERAAFYGCSSGILEG